MPAMPDLEDEMCLWEPSSNWSPNRIDALVFAVTELALKNEWSVVIDE